MTPVSVESPNGGIRYAGMDTDTDIGQQLGRFAAMLPRLCAQLDGDRLLDAVHRLYEEILCQTPQDLLDPVHDAMHLLMHRHGLVRRPPAIWSDNNRIERRP